MTEWRISKPLYLSIEPVRQRSEFLHSQRLAPYAGRKTARINHGGDLFPVQLSAENGGQAVAQCLAPEGEGGPYRLEKEVLPTGG